MKKHLSPVVAILAILTFFVVAGGRVEASDPPPVGIIGSWLSGTTHAKETGTNRALVLLAHAESSSTTPPSISGSVTYGGQTMTQVVSRSNSSGTTRTYTAAYILNDAGITAATGSPPSFSVTWSNAAASVLDHVFLQNVNQTTLYGATDSNQTTSGTTISTTSSLATAVGDMVISAATASSAGTYTANNGFNKALESNLSSGDSADINKAATGVNETPSVTSAGTRQTIVGFVVKARPIRKLTVSSSAGGTVSTPGIGDFNYPDGNNASIVASANANYYFINWTGTAVTAGKVANPDSPDATVLMDANYTVQANFADGIHISGTITCGDLEVNEANLMGLGVVTDANGFYTTTVDQGWSGAVTPVKYGYTFDPNSRTYTSVTSDLTAQDYNALPADDFNDNRRGSMWRRSH